MYMYSAIRCAILMLFFFFNDTATTEIYTLSLHDALPISLPAGYGPRAAPGMRIMGTAAPPKRSEEHTSELQSLAYLVCRLLLEKKKKTKTGDNSVTADHHVTKQKRQSVTIVSTRRNVSNH